VFHHLTREHRELLRIENEESHHDWPAVELKRDLQRRSGWRTLNPMDERSKILLLPFVEKKINKEISCGCGLETGS